MDAPDRDRGRTERGQGPERGRAAFTRIVEDPPATVPFVGKATRRAFRGDFRLINSELSDAPMAPFAVGFCLT